MLPDDLAELIGPGASRPTHELATNAQLRCEVTYHLAYQGPELVPDPPGWLPAFDEEDRRRERERDETIVGPTRRRDRPAHDMPVEGGTSWRPTVPLLARQAAVVLDSSACGLVGSGSEAAGGGDTVKVRNDFISRDSGAG